jgi:hypothetical protein
MNQGTHVYPLVKKNEGQKSRETVPLIVASIGIFEASWGQDVEPIEGDSNGGSAPI